MGEKNKCYVDWNLCLQSIRDQLNGSEYSTDWRKDTSTLVNGFLKQKSLREELEGFHSKYQRQQYDNTGKSKTISEDSRRKGNSFYEKGITDEALKCYTKSVVHAPPKSEALALAYSNRSAVLLKVEKYEDCLLNIDASLKLNPPESCQVKLKLRKAKCLVELGDKEAASNAIKEVEETNKANSKDLRNLRQKLEAISDSPPEEERNERRSELLDGSNPKIPSASAVISMKVNEEKGRHTVSTKDVEMGSALFEEKPYASVLLPDFCVRYCSDCYRIVKVPVPCDYCSEISFCSDSCRDHAWETFHQYECRWLSYLHTIGIAYLALRIVLVTGFTKLLDFRERLHLYKGVPGCDADGVYGPAEDGYLSVYHLCSHHDVFFDEDIKAYTMMSCLLLTYLSRCTEFFGKRLNEDDWMKDESVLYVGSLLLRHIQQLICNAHSITCVQGDEDVGVTEMLLQRRIATAVYPTASLMNHSCSPNILNSFDGKTLIVRAARNIKKGEEVLNCYGPHCGRMRRIERREALKMQYFFDCHCGPCTDPDYLIEEAKWNGLLCPCGGAMPTTMNDKHTLRERLPNLKGNGCMSCGSVLEGIPAILKELTMAIDLQEESQEEDGEEVVSLMNRCLRIRERYLHPQNIELIHTRDAVAKVLAEQGHWKECAETVEKCLQVVELRFGKYSQEVAFELEKYADVLVNLLSTSPDVNVAVKLMEVSARLLGLMKIHVGSDTAAFHQVRKRVRVYQQMLQCYYSTL